MNIIFTTLLLLLTLLTLKAQDTIVMKNGNVYTGEVEFTDDDYIRIISDSSVSFFPRESVITIKTANSNKKTTYEEVVEVDGVSKNDLFERARMWFAESFVDAQSVIQIKDKEAGEIMGKGIIKHYSKQSISMNTLSGNIKFTVKVFVKEGRYKYIFKDFIHEATPTKGYWGEYSFGLITEDVLCPYFDLRGSKKAKDKGWSEIQTTIKVYVHRLINSLKAKMNVPTEGDDW